MNAREHNFHCWASSGICDICGEHTSVIADVATMRYKCFNCLVKENLEYEEKQRQRKRIPLDMEDFCK